MFVGGGLGCCLANISMVAILAVDDPLITLANPYDLIVPQDHTKVNEIVRETGINAKKEIIRQNLIK